MPHQLTRIMNAERIDNGDKLRHGPCAKQYIDLEDCAADKKVRSHAVSPNNRRTRQATMAKMGQAFYYYDATLLSCFPLCGYYYFWSHTGKVGSLSKTDRRSDSMYEKESPIFPFQSG